MPVFEVLLVVIGVLVLIGLLLMGRSRRGGSDPSTSVDAFHRALSAMEPGGRGQRRTAEPETDGHQDAETQTATADAPIDLTRPHASAEESAEQDSPGR